MSQDHAAAPWWLRWLSPDHRLGQSMLWLRAQADLARWRPQNAADLALKDVVRRVAPAFTMVDVRRLRRLAAHAAAVHADGVPGAVVECGTWRGGSLAIADWALRSLGDARLLWGFDSFEGLPPPGEHDPESAHRGFFQGWCAASPDDVRNAIRAAGGQAECVRLVPGLLNRTLAGTDTGPIALLNVDVDWYDSVTEVFEQLFDRMSPGAIINVDDYGRWAGCDRAVHAFLDRRDLPVSILNRGHGHGAWLRVPLPPSSPARAPNTTTRQVP